MGAILANEQFARLLDKRLTDVSEQEAKNAELKAMIPKLFKVVDSDSAFEESFYIGGAPDIPEFNGKISYLSVAPGFHKKVEHKEFAGGLQAERKLIDDKKFAVLDDRAKMLMRSAYRTQEKYGARAFAYAFSSAFDFMTSEEGVSLCSSAHKTKAGVSTTTGFNNTGTSALSKTALATARLTMRKFKLDNGERFEPSDNLALLVPDNLYDTAMEIVGTPAGYETTAQTKNMAYQRFEVIPYLRLDDFDTNNWFLVDKDAMKQSLIWYNRVKPESKNTVDYDTYALLQAIYFRCSYGWNDWRWIYGQNVA